MTKTNSRILSITCSTAGQNPVFVVLAVKPQFAMSHLTTMRLWDLFLGAFGTSGLLADPGIWSLHTSFFPNSKKLKITKVYVFWCFWPQGLFCNTLFTLLNSQFQASVSWWRNLALLNYLNLNLAVSITSGAISPHRS